MTKSRTLRGADPGYNGRGRRRGRWISGAIYGSDLLLFFEGEALGAGALRGLTELF